MKNGGCLSDFFSMPCLFVVFGLMILTALFFVFAVATGMH